MSVPGLLNCTKSCRWLLLAAACLFSAVAPSSSAGQTADALAGTREIDEELRKLDETPVGKQIAEIEQKFSTATEQVGKAREKFQAQYFQLRQ